MSKPKSWEVSDAFWNRVEPLVPVRQRSADKTYRRRACGGRKPKDARLVFEAIVHVLRTGCQWKALSAERFGSASAIHARFLEWEKAGFFEALWKAGLAEYDDLNGIAWRWQSIDGAMMKAPMVQEAVGPNLTDDRRECTADRRECTADRRECDRRECNATAELCTPVGRRRECTARGKKREQTAFAGRRAWSPVVPHRHRSQPA
jgi:transposase